MTTIISDVEEIRVVRSEANFDRACDSAWARAVDLWGIDDNGRIPAPALLDAAVPWDRTTDSIRVAFIGYNAGCSGSVYTFSTYLQRADEI